MALVTVDVDLSDFDTDDLLEEIQDREERHARRRHNAGGLPDGFDPIEGKGTIELAEACFEARRRGDDARALELVDRLIYAALGRII